MSYIYTKRNLLEEPHNYMYSEFKGREFVEDYLQNRISLLQELELDEPVEMSVLDQNVYFAARKVFSRIKHSTLTIPRNFLPKSVRKPLPLKKTDLPNSFPNTEKIETLKLLNGILYALINEGNLTKEIWLTRLIQRFEVTKKLKEFYLPGFRKSEGSYKEIRLYQLFSIVLAIAHSQTGQLQYLSTLLKVNDLILSLPIKMFETKDNIPSWSMGVVLEIASISSILKY